MPERKKDGILSLNVKKLLILHLVWKTNRILQYGSLFFIMQLILVQNMVGLLLSFFLGAVLTTGLGASILSKNSLMYLSTKSRGNLYRKRKMVVYLF